MPMPIEPTGRREFDVLIVGAGPAGLAAAVEAAASGRSVGVVDDNPDLGGQIWRGERPKPKDPQAASWFRRVEQADFEAIPGTRIFGAEGPDTLLAESAGRVVEIGFKTLILATGARERFVPFPGWTLPNVVGAGGFQALIKSGLPVAGKSVVVAGSGPLLLAVAALAKRRGAKVRAIVEQAPTSALVRFALGLGTAPGKLRQAVGLRLGLGLVPYLAGRWVVEATGEGMVRSARLSDGRSIACDYLACGFGLVPNLELPTILGCRVEAGVTAVDGHQRTSISGIYCAGEATGIGGVDLALLEGQIAGMSAVGRLDEARALFPGRDRARRFADALERTFALRPELRRLPQPDTIVCRCEDVTAGALADRPSWVDAKLQTRCGMGPCQGRICGPAAEFLYGWPAASVRPPIFPVAVGSLASLARADS